MRLAEGSQDKDRLRVGLVGEGTYPVAKGGVSTWCDQLVNELPDYDFSIVALVGHERDIVWELPNNVTSVVLEPMWETPGPLRIKGRRPRVEQVRRLLDQLWDIALATDIADDWRVQRASDVLKGLSQVSYGQLGMILSHRGSAQSILDAWQRHRVTTPSHPEMSLRETAFTASLADRMLAVLDTQWPEVDIVHASANGPSALIALARKWRDGTPIILTEHGVYLREQYLSLRAMTLPWTVRSALTSLTELICRVVYAEADLLAPVSDFNAKWARRLGAKPQDLTTLRNGVDVATFPPIITEPEVPTLSFVGRIDPLKDLHTLIHAFALARREIPDLRLRLFGPIPPQNHSYHDDLQQEVASLGLSSGVTFEGAVPSARIAAEAGHIVCLSSISEGLPFTVIEAMMCGRPTISTDVGGVAEITGRTGGAGIVVPPRDPAAMADAAITLLHDQERRRHMGNEARRRALEMFSLSTFRANVAEIYETLTNQRGARYGKYAVA